MVVNEDYIVSNIKGLRDGLELGCGYGDFILRLLKKGFNVYGVDTCSSCVEYANNLFRDEGFGERCYVMNAESLSHSMMNHSILYM